MAAQLPDICQEPANIMANCDFSNGLDHWQPFTEDGGANFSVLQGGGECHAPLCPAAYIVTEGHFVGGLYQQVPVTPGNVYYANVIWLVFDALINDGSIHALVGGIGRRIGIDPTGGADSRSPNVVWSEDNWRNDCKICGVEHVTVTAQADVITVFLRLDDTWRLRAAEQGMDVPRSKDQFWIDDIGLKQVSEGEAPAPQPTEEPPPPTDTPPPPPTATPVPQEDPLNQAAAVEPVEAQVEQESEAEIAEAPLDDESEGELASESEAAEAPTAEAVASAAVEEPLAEPTTAPAIIPTIAPPPTLTPTQTPAPTATAVAALRTEPTLPSSVRRDLVSSETSSSAPVVSAELVGFASTTVCAGGAFLLVVGVILAGVGWLYKLGWGKVDDDEVYDDNDFNDVHEVDTEIVDW